MCFTGRRTRTEVVSWRIPWYLRKTTEGRRGITRQPTASCRINCPKSLCEAPLLNYRERPLSSREQRLFNRLLRQRNENLPWWRFFLSLPLVTVIFGAEHRAHRISMIGWASPWLLILLGMYSGIVLHAAASYRIARRTWPMLVDILTDYVDRASCASYGACRATEITLSLLITTSASAGASTGLWDSG